MKKLVNLLSLVVLLGVIAFIRVGYAQESENPEVGENLTSTETSIEVAEEGNPDITVSYANNVVTYVDSQGNEFEMGTITISDGTDSITMLDRNLGATSTGGTDSYGYHFQWGNNYGFDWRNVPDHAVGQVNAEDYGWNHPYSSNIFLKLNRNWDSSNNSYLWGYDEDGDYAMQGPCPVGYHVPSINEWSNVLKMYHDMNPKGSTIEGGNLPVEPVVAGLEPITYRVESIAFRKAFQDAFYIPLAGFRNNDYQLTNQGSEARFWTSTPDENDEIKSRRFYIGNNVVDSINSKERVYGYSVRCFQNTDDSDTVTLSFDTRGGSTIQPILWPAGENYFEPSTPIKEGDKFLGWYLDENLTMVYNMSSPINNDTTFYAKWRSDVIIYEDDATTYTDTLGNVFNMGSITVTDGTYSITILDRNLGATDTQGEEAYGYHFQRGNNYGFPWYDDIEVGNDAVDASGYNRHSPYVSDEFIIGGEYWDSSKNNDLWGDIVDEDYARQGPCPDGYHVPTISEWGDLIDLYSVARGFMPATSPFLGLEAAEATSTVDPLAFREELQSVLKITLANRRMYSDGQIEQLGKDARIWASTADSGGVKAGRFYVGGTTVDTSYNQRAYGYSLRCFKNVDDSDNVVLHYEVNGGTAIQAQTLPKGATGYLPGYTTSKQGDELIGWYSDEGMTTLFDFNSPLNEDTTIYAKRALSYMVTFKDWDGSILKREVVHQGENATAPENPTRNGYTFKGWDKPVNNITHDVDINAVYEKIDTGGHSSGGGGGGNTHKTDSKGDGPSTENTSSSDDKKPQELEHGSAPEDTNLNNGGSSKKDTQQLNIDAYDSNYTEEFNRAYQFSSNNNITSKPTIKDAKMYTPLTRIQMAKMLSQYAMNVLGQEPDMSRGFMKFRDVTNKMDAEYDNAVTLSYELGIMGINMPNNEFRPNDIVTRGEFATALSRMIYGTSDGIYKQTAKYYTLHIQKLEQEKILTKVDPSMTELRGYVMIMLMRLASMF